MVYPSRESLERPSAAPWYQVRDRLVYAVDGHPGGPSATPVFVIDHGHVFPVPWIEDTRTAWFRVGDDVE